MTEISIRFRVDFGPRRALGPGKVALLEGIAQSGSLSEAARELKMSYRRAWLLLEDMNTAFQERVVETSVGGRGGGGAQLTSFGRSLIDAYRELEADIRQRAQNAFPPAALLAPARDQGIPAAPRRRINRSSATKRRAQR
jgi:molybdate transport system regulatory protein